jgi:hydroxymethylpyrimidine pyrophosphatase-like HAD family hydrolase
MSKTHKTIFSDIDGCILFQGEHFLDVYNDKQYHNPKFLPGSKEKLLEWWTKGYRIVLTTGRPEYEHDRLAEMLSTNGVYFHKLVMDCGSGIRVLINDIPPDGLIKAVAVNINRDTGFETIGEEI